MTDAMAHRGPNDRGIHLAPGIALGARRLSIIDVEGGHQPFANETGDRLGCAERGALQPRRAPPWARAGGHRFRSRCDTEILPHLFEEHGDGFVARVHGKFGARGLGCEPAARVDRAGSARGQADLLRAGRRSRPLRVGAEERACKRSRRAELDCDAIDAYLTLGFVPGPLTPLAAVRKLMPGDRLVVERRTRPGRALLVATRSPTRTTERRRAGAAAGLLEVLDEAVRLRLMSDVPLGAMLSGGMDSSLIVALMAAT